MLNYRAWRIYPNFPYPSNGPSCNLLTDTLKWSLEEVPCAESDMQAVGRVPLH